jgi:AcrR family transcriptional regulator
VDEVDGRRRRAAKTRRRVIDAASARFVAHGYATTTIGDIARDAAVAPQTVYYEFGSKCNVLAAVVDAAIVGDVDQVAVLDRPWVGELAAIADADAAVDHLVINAVAILARIAPVYEVLSQAASDPAVGRLHAAVRAGRRSDQRALVETLAAGGHLRADITVDLAADIVYALVNEDVFLLLVEDCGWTRAQVGSWMATSVRQQLLDA